MAQNWWDQYEAVTEPGRTIKEEDIIAGTRQSEASTEKSREEAITEREMRPYKVKKAAAESATTEREAEKPGLTPGQEKIDEQFGEDYLQWAVRGGRGDFQKARAQLNEALGALESSDSISGPVLGVMPDWLKSMVAPQSIQYPEEVQEIAQRNLRAILGGQFAQKEGEQLIARAFNPRLDEATNKVRVQRLLKAMVSAAESKEDAARYYEEHGTLVGWEGALPTKQDFDIDYDKAVDDELGLYGAEGTVTDEGGGAGSGPGGGGGGGKPPSGGGDGRYSLSSITSGLGQGLGSLVEGAGNIPGLVADPILTTLGRLGGYDNYTADTGRLLRESLGLPENQSPMGSAILEGVGGAAGGAGIARQGAMLAQPGALRGALSTFGAQPGRDMAAGAAAGGAGEFTAEMGGGPLAQAGASLLGGGVGFGGASTLRRMVAPKAPTELAMAAERQGVGLLPADAGGRVSNIMTEAALASPFSSGAVTKAADRTQAQLGDAARRVTQSQARGEVPPTDAAGEFLQQAAKRYSAKTKDIGTTLYRRAFDAAGDVRVPAPNAVKTLDGLLKELRSAPETNATSIQQLLKLRRDLSKGLTAENMHALRSEIAQGVYDGNLRSGTDKGRMKAVRGALTDDMLGFFDKNFMPSVSKGIRRADKYHEERVEHIDEVLQPIVGKDGFKGGEQVVQTLESMARGNQGGNKRLSRLMSNMTGDERRQVRATVIDRIGRAPASGQTAEGEAFSAKTFLTNWNRMTPQAKATLFGDKGLRDSLNDIAKLAEGSKTSQRAAKHEMGRGALLGNVALQTAWAVGHLPSYLAGAGAQYVTGKLMASPRFARWLAKAPIADTPDKQRRALDQLGVIATREPALQQDVLALRQHLEKSMSQSPAANVPADEPADEEI